MPTQTSPFQGIWIPLVTPFSGGAVDGGALRRLVRHYAAAGVDGLVVCGSTGEAAALDDAEQLAVLDAVLSVADGLPVMMGLAGNHQGHVLRRLSAFGTRPLAGILAPAPYYVRPGQAGASAYFRCLADASRFPLALYDIPYRTGAALDTATLLELAAHEHRRHQGLRRLAGKDRGADRRWPAASVGGRGFADAVDLVPGWFRHHRGRRAHPARPVRGAVPRRARAAPGPGPRAVLALAPMIQLAFAEPNPGPVKAQLARQGLLTDELRAPMPAASAALADRLQAAVAELDRAFPPR